MELCSRTTAGFIINFASKKARSTDYTGCLARVYFVRWRTAATAERSKVEVMNNSKKVAGLAGIVSVLWMGLTAAVAANQRRLLFNPIGSKREVLKPYSTGHRTRPIVVRAKDGTRLSGWLMTPPVKGPHPGVIYFGGRSEEVSWVARDAGKLFPGMAVLAVNYRGYGDSHGDPAEAHFVEDGRMLFDWLSERHHVDPRRIAVVGRSLGSGVAVQVAMEREANAIVLITPYDSILAIAKRKLQDAAGRIRAAA
jgi:acetyl esterase/lipase